MPLRGSTDSHMVGICNSEKWQYSIKKELPHELKISVVEFHNV